MIGGNRVLAVVPARSGSKGIPDKNMQRLAGHTLIARAAMAIRGCQGIDRALISTDAERYAEEGRRHGLDAPFLRPGELSTDTTGAIETVLHALHAAEAHYAQSFDVVVIVEPTCPLRSSSDIRGAIDLLVSSGAQSVVSVSLVDTKFHPRKVLRIQDGRLLFYLAEGATVKTRQSLAPVYYRNGACYALTRHCLVDRQVIFGEHTLPFVIDRPLVNIDEPADMALAQMLVDSGR